MKLSGWLSAGWAEGVEMVCDKQCPWVKREIRKEIKRKYRKTGSDVVVFWTKLDRKHECAVRGCLQKVLAYLNIHLMIYS